MNVDMDYENEKEHIAAHPMLIPKYESQEDLNKSLQVLAKACTENPIPKIKPSIMRTGVKLRSDKAVRFSKSSIRQKEKLRVRPGTSTHKSRVLPK